MEFAVILLALLTFVLPVVAVCLLVDKDRKSIIPMITGALTYLIFEACIVLPVINFLGYSLTVAIIGIIIIEVVRYLVLKIGFGKRQQFTTKAGRFFIGYAIVNLIVVWGIDALQTAAVVLISDFDLVGGGEYWLAILTAFIKVIMLYAYTWLTMNAVKAKKGGFKYVLAAIGLHIISDENIIGEVCNIIGIDSLVRVLLLVAITGITAFLIIKKKDFFWKDNGNED